MIGFIIFGIMWMMSGTIGSNVLFPERFNGLNIGQPQAILAAMNSVGSIFALFSNLVFGALFRPLPQPLWQAHAVYRSRRFYLRLCFLEHFGRDHFP
ncbi:MAG: hypothetical protein ACLS89_02180 [Collinsella sp.]